MNARPLFSAFDLSDVLQARYREMESVGQGMESNRILNTSHEDIADHLVSRFHCEPLELLEDQIFVEDSETGVDVSRDSSRLILDRTRPHYISGIEIKYVLPYRGDGQLLHCRPSTFTYGPPHAEINGQTLILRYRTADHDVESIKQQYGRDKSEIQRYFTNIRRDVTTFNAGLRERALGALRARKAKLLKDQGLVASLGVPIKKRDDTPQTYQIPMQKKIIPLPQLPPTTAAFQPEPAIDLAQYDDIISIVSSMVHVIERSPSAFEKMKEEDLRQHFLVQLNGQFKGQATGETFNMSGKTDILIRVNDKNVFVAECKYWKGKQSLVNAINQLLGYSSWRDSKAAIILFVRDKQFGAIVEQIPEIVAGHALFKREVERRDTAYRCILRNQEDPEKEIIVTILAFHLPNKQ